MGSGYRESRLLHQDTGAMEGCRHSCHQSGCWAAYFLCPHGPHEKAFSWIFLDDGLLFTHPLAGREELPDQWASKRSWAQWASPFFLPPVGTIL